MAEPLIELKNIYKIYHMGDEEVRASDGVSLSIDRGEFVAIVGKSGSGKSTLMNIIGALDVPTEGEYILGGEDVSEMSDDQLAQIRNKMIRFIFQQYNLLPKLNLLENVELPLLYAGVPVQERKERALKSLAKVGLEEKWKNLPNQLSGGQQQRVSIARALAGDPSLILADEPTKGLDEERIEMVVDAFHSLKDQAVLCVTHDLNFAREISDSISVMYASNQVEYASAKELLEHPLHPYTQDMIAAMPENGLHFSEGFAMAHEDYAEGGCKYAPRCRFCKEKCKETPPMLEVEGHQVRCWLYTGKEGECHASDNGKAL